MQVNEAASEQGTTTEKVSGATAAHAAGGKANLAAPSHVAAGMAPEATNAKPKAGKIPVASTDNVQSSYAADDHCSSYKAEAGAKDAISLDPALEQEEENCLSDNSETEEYYSNNEEEEDGKETQVSDSQGEENEDEGTANNLSDNLVSSKLKNFLPVSKDDLHLGESVNSKQNLDDLANELNISLENIGTVCYKIFRQSKKIYIENM